MLLNSGFKTKANPEPSSSEIYVFKVKYWQFSVTSPAPVMSEHRAFSDQSIVRKAD